MQQKGRRLTKLNTGLILNFALNYGGQLYKRSEVDYTRMFFFFRC